MSTKLRTVRGDIEPSEMGSALPHEHVLGSVDVFWEPSDDPLADPDPESGPTLANLWHWRENPTANRGNVHLATEEEAVDEIKILPDLGVGTLVCVSPFAPEPGDNVANATGLKRVSEATGVHIVSGTSYYVADFYPEEIQALTEDQMVEQIVQAVTVGIGGTDVRAGIIGEVGLSSWPPVPFEERSLAASVRAQRQTGAALTIHNPYFMPLETLREVGQHLVDLGADMSRVIMGHCDGFARDPRFIDLVADEEYYIEVDMFGVSGGYIPAADFVLPSDEVRVEAILNMIEAGLGDRLLLSHDICLKTSRETYGGNGYGYIHRVIAPWLRRRGAGDDALDQILVRNGQKVLPMVTVD